MDTTNKNAKHNFYFSQALVLKRTDWPDCFIVYSATWVDKLLSKTYTVNLSRRSKMRRNAI